MGGKATERLSRDGIVARWGIRVGARTPRPVVDAREHGCGNSPHRDGSEVTIDVPANRRAVADIDRVDARVDGAGRWVNETPVEVDVEDNEPVVRVGLQVDPKVTRSTGTGGDKAITSEQVAN